MYVNLKELDRLGRNMDQIKQEWQEPEKLGVNIVVLGNPVLNTEGKTDLERKVVGNMEKWRNKSCRSNGFNGIKEEYIL